MKTVKILIIAIAIILGCSSIAGATNYEYVPLVQEGATWNYVSFLHKKPYPFSIYIQGDTTLAGVVSKKCYLKFYETYSDSCLTENEISYIRPHQAQLIAYLREADKKVYCLYSHYNYSRFFNSYEWGKCVRQELNNKVREFTYGEWLIYDFNDVESILNAPRSTKQYPYLSMKYSVANVDEVEIGNVKRKRYQLRTNYYFATDSLNYSQLDGLYIIEGLGFVRMDKPAESTTPNDVDIFLSPKADAVTYLMFNADMSGLAETSFLYKEEGGQKVAGSYYDGKHKFNLNDKPTGVENIEIEADDTANGDYYNLMGQKVNPENMESGIYIHNHQKVMVKK